MPPSMPRSAVSGPRPRRWTSASASANPTSVKTATAAPCSELEHVPDPRAVAVAAAGCGGTLPIEPAVVGQHLVGGHVRLGLDRDALGPAAVAHLVDAGAGIL